MLRTLWLLLSMLIALAELFAAAQPNWIVHCGRQLVQGLFTVCDVSRCRMRTVRVADGASSSLITLVPLGQLSGTLLLGFSAIIACGGFVICARGGHAQRRILVTVAKAQCAAVLLLLLSVCAVPMDMEEVHCTVPLLLESTECRIGWAYALHCIATMLAICCPILAKVVADQSKRYKPLITERYV